MSSDAVIRLRGLSKCYHIYDAPKDRLRQFLWRGKKKFYREFWALRAVDLELHHGEVVGVIGKNGSGKSTLLQLVCGTLTPTSGEVSVQGRIAALLELGAGFNPEFTGRENVYLNASILGLTDREIEARFDQIAAFADIGEFIDQPVKTYSSGMFVRLAFAVAVNVDPDILVIDEALSVGDGEFSRKSFDRIMQFKEAGKTILFCSHSLYQIEAICNRAIWLDHGEIQASGEPSKVVAAYDAYLNTGRKPGQPEEVVQAQAEPAIPAATGPTGAARITSVELSVDGEPGKHRFGVTSASSVAVRVTFASDPRLPTPSVAVCFTGPDGRFVTSASTQMDRVEIPRTPEGAGMAIATFDRFGLLKGDYWVDVYLMCERAIHVYDRVVGAARLSMSQTHLEQGVVSLPRVWQVTGEAPAGRPVQGECGVEK